MSGAAKGFKTSAQLVYTYLEKSLSWAHGNIEDKNKVLESSIIVVNCHIIISNLYNEWIVLLLCYCIILLVNVSPRKMLKKKI